MSTFQFDVHPSHIVTAIRTADRPHVAVHPDDATDPQECYPVDKEAPNLTIAFHQAFATALNQYPDCTSYGLITSGELLAKSSSVPYGAELYASPCTMVRFTLVAQ